MKTYKQKIRDLEEEIRFWKGQYYHATKDALWSLKLSNWIKESCSGEQPKAPEIPLELVFDLPIKN